MSTLAWAAPRVPPVHVGSGDCPSPPESYIYPIFFPVSKRLGQGFVCRLGREGYGQSSGRIMGAK